MSKGTPAPKKRRSRLLALEPRVLFDGAIVDAAAAVAKAADATPPDVSAAAAKTVDATPADTSSYTADAAARQVPAAAEPAAASQASSEWLVIDAAVPDAAQLLANARPGMNVLLLDAQRDGVEQIRAAIEASGQGVSALHIVSHGAPGYLTLGSTQLDGEQLAAHAEDLQALQRYLQPGADVLLYGCDVASGAAGQAFVQEFAQLTGADVAASTDATGGATMQGNWTFEYATGSIEATPFLAAADGATYTARLSRTAGTPSG